MPSRELKVARIGNSRGVRIPAATLDRYEIGESVLMEEREDGILLRPHGAKIPKLSWKETAQRIAKEREEWTDWDPTVGDGLESIPWDEKRPRRVAEPGRRYPRDRK